MTPPTPIRSRKHYLDAIASLRVESNPKYLRRDITGDGLPETFCNFFLTDATHLLGCPVPLMLATAQIEWLESYAGRAEGWHECDESKAGHAAEAGHPTVAAWANPSGFHSHVALVVPKADGAPGHGLHIAQAGRHNYANTELQRGFGTLLPRYWTHE